MKTKFQKKKIPNLNLYNFDSPEAGKCEYILTSPRSLAACKRAGYKPVELLYKSAEEYQEDLGAESVRSVYELFLEQEKDRQNKLEKCRLFRREIIAEQEQRNEQTSRKDQLNRKNTLIAAESLDTEKLKIDGSGIDANSLTGESSTTSGAEQKRRNKNIKHEAAIISRQTNKAEEFNKTCTKSAHSVSSITKDSSLQKLISPTSDTASSFSSSSSLYVTGRCPRRSSYNIPREKSTGFKTKENKNLEGSRLYPKKLETPSSSLRHGSASSCASKLRTDTNNNKTSRETGKKKAKQVSFGCISPDHISLSDHDRRILQLLALKKTLERENDDLAYHAHLSWERDRDIREMLINEQESLWKNYITSKRSYESNFNAFKMEQMKTSLRHAQLELEQQIKHKEERAARLKRDAEDKKLNEVLERNFIAANRRSEVESIQHQMEVESAMYQKELGREQYDRLKRAEASRILQKESYRRRVVSANRAEELHHQERWCQVQQETEAALKNLRAICQMREQKAHLRYEEILKHRDQAIKDQSLEREIRFQQTRLLSSDLEKGLEKWQNQVKSLQMAAAEKAEISVSQQREGKKLRIEAENKQREMVHSKILERLTKEEAARIYQIRQNIARKEAKMKILAMEREMAIRESRLHAQTTADLREYVRQSISPDTFNRKVARVELEMRVAGRPPTASPIMTRSHIHLG